MNVELVLNSVRVSLLLNVILVQTKNAIFHNLTNGFQ